MTKTKKNRLLEDNEEYVVTLAWTPKGPLRLTGKELKKRPDLKGRYVYSADKTHFFNKFKLIRL